MGFRVVVSTWPSRAGPRTQAGRGGAALGACQRQLVCAAFLERCLHVACDKGMEPTSRLLMMHRCVFHFVRFCKIRVAHGLLPAVLFRCFLHTYCHIGRGRHEGWNIRGSYVSTEHSIGLQVVWIHQYSRTASHGTR